MPSIEIVQALLDRGADPELALVQRLPGRSGMDGGDTSLGNLVATCQSHHRYLHEYGCSIELHDDGPHFLDRRGRRILEAPPPSRPPDLGWETLLARNAELQISAATNEPLWDGARVDAYAVIDALLGVERTEATRGWS